MVAVDKGYEVFCTQDRKMITLTFLQNVDTGFLRTVEKEERVERYRRHGPIKDSEGVSYIYELV